MIWIIGIVAYFIALFLCLSFFMAVSVLNNDHDYISEEYRNSHLEGRFPGRDLGD
jgi:hypothetical protein